MRHNNDRDMLSVSNLFPRWPVSSSGMFYMALDLKETNNGYVVEGDVPGFNSENLSVNVTDKNVLTVEGERNREHTDESDTMHVYERHYGKVYRSIVLPEDVDMDSLEATVSDGVLSVSMKKMKNFKKNVKVVDIKK